MGLAVLYVSILPDVLVLVSGNVQSLLNDSGVEVVVRNDFVQRRQDDTLRVRTLKNSSDKGLDELSLMNVDAGPCGEAQECLVVVGTQQDSVQESNFLAKLADRVGVDGAFGLDQTSLYGADIVLHKDRVFELMIVVLDVIAGAEDLQLFVRDRLGDLLQQQNAVLLFLQELLIGWGKRKKKGKD